MTSPPPHLPPPSLDQRSLHHTVLRNQQRFNHTHAKQYHALIRLAANKTALFQTFARELKSVATLSQDFAKIRQACVLAIAELEVLESEYLKMLEWRNQRMLKLKYDQLESVYQEKKKTSEPALEEFFEKDVQTFLNQKKIQDASKLQKTKLEAVKLNVRKEDLDSFFDDDEVQESKDQEERHQDDDEDDWD